MQLSVLVQGYLVMLVQKIFAFCNLEFVRIGGLEMQIAYVPKVTRVMRNMHQYKPLYMFIGGPFPLGEQKIFMRGV